MVRRIGWFDWTLATVFFVACETELFVIVARHGGAHPLPLVIDAVFVAGITVPSAARRIEPEAVAGVMFGALLLLALGPARWQSLVLPQFVLFVVPYAVAAYSRRTRPLAGLAICLIPVILIGGVVSADHSGAWFTVLACGSSWVLGRYVRSNRILTARLHATAAQIADEREDRERLVVAEQRTLIARELQSVVADQVSAMTLQAQAAQRLVEAGDPHADDAMAVIEETGREAMSELRRLLGALRRDDAAADLSPQPGVGQIPALVERARGRRPITLRVQGDPAALATSTDLGLYRILEDVLSGDTEDAVDIALRFGGDHIEMRVTVGRVLTPNWPTAVTYERVALCEGKLEVTSTTGDTVLVVRLPRALQGAVL